MEKKRSIGVTVFGIIAIIISLFLLFAYASLATLPSVGFLTLVIPIIIAISFLVSGMCILRLYNWARILFMFQMVYWAIIGLKGVRAFYILDLAEIGKGSNYPESWVGWVVFFVLPAFVSIYFFTRPKVKEQFKM